MDRYILTEWMEHFFILDQQTRVLPFDIVDYQIPGTGIAYFDGFDGDSYAIDAQGNNVAIVVGGLGRGVQLFKSTKQWSFLDKKQTY